MAKKRDRKFLSNEIEELVDTEEGVYKRNAKKKKKVVKQEYPLSREGVTNAKKEFMDKFNRNKDS